MIRRTRAARETVLYNKKQYIQENVDFANDLESYLKGAKKARFKTGLSEELRDLIDQVADYLYEFQKDFPKELGYDMSIDRNFEWKVK